MENIVRKVMFFLILAMFLVNMNLLFRYASEDTIITRAEEYQPFGNKSDFTSKATNDDSIEKMVNNDNGSRSRGNEGGYAVNGQGNLDVKDKHTVAHPLTKVAKYFPFESNVVEVDPLGFHPRNESTPSECLIRYPANDKLHFNNLHWQVLETKNWTFYIYSAFYDNRELIGQNPVIRILGIMNSFDIGNSTKGNELFCQLWFSELPNAKVVKGLIPFAVSIVSSKCEEAVNKVKVIHASPPPPHESHDGFAVCVKGLDFPDLDISLRLVEWIELIRLLGASKIQIYLYAVHSNTKNVLDYYIDKGVIQVGPLTLPGAFPNDPLRRHKYLLKHVLQKRQLEILPYNDCLYRNMYHYKYLALLDIDEVIVPLTVKSWKELLETYTNFKINEKKGKVVTSFQVRQNGCFFEGVKRPWFDQIPKTAHMLQHVFKIPRENGRFGIGTKGFIIPSRVFIAFNHWPTACLKRPCHSVKLDETRAQLQHYKHVQRHCGLHKGTDMYNCQHLTCLNYTVDKTLWKYKDDLISNVNNAISAIFKDQPPTQWDGKDKF